MTYFFDRISMLAAVVLVLYVFTLPATAADHCIDTGFNGLTANYVNTDITGETIDVDCDVGAFFDTRGIVDGAVFTGTVANAASVQYGVLVVDGANVRVQNSVFDVEDDYPHQWIGIGLRNGAKGVITGNEMVGFKRAGIFLDGDGTSAQVRNNTLAGVGKKTSGWAENGIQVSRGANAVVMNNTVFDHYWGNNSWASSGIIVFDSDDVSVSRNYVGGGDMGIYLAGNSNNATHNVVETSEDPDISVFNDGIIVIGDNNGLRQNSIVNLRDDNVDIGIIVFPGSSNTKLIRNEIENFDLSIWDGGDDTKLPAPFVPDDL